MAKQTDPARTKKRKKAVRKRPAPVLIKLYDGKKFEGTVPSFANITLEEMRSWRDDRGSNPEVIIAATVLHLDVALLTANSGFGRLDKLVKVRKL
ncbi:MAG: hypothetical protein WBB32_10000 [Flavobacteriales bacterium]